MNSETEARPPDQQQAGNAGNAGNPVYYYKDSGIRERHGGVPLWLVAVAGALLIWGIYYLVMFWSPPPG